MSLGGGSKRRCECFVYFLSFICQQIIIQVSYTIPIDRANTNTSHIRRQSSSGSLSLQSLSVSSGWSNLLPRGCRLIIGQYETMARRNLQTNIDLLILLSPPESLHRYGRAINATDATSKLPWIFHSSISFSQSNKLSQSCKLTPSYHTLATSSRHFNTQVWHNT